MGKRRNARPVSSLRPQRAGKPFFFLSTVTVTEYTVLIIALLSTCIYLIPAAVPPLPSPHFLPVSYCVRASALLLPFCFLAWASETPIHRLIVFKVFHLFVGLHGRPPSLILPVAPLSYPATNESTARKLPCHHSHCAIIIIDTVLYNLIASPSHYHLQTACAPRSVPP